MTQVIVHQQVKAVQINSRHYVAKVRNETGDLRHYDVRRRHDGWYIILVDMDDDGPYATIPNALAVINDWYKLD